VAAAGVGRGVVVLVILQGFQPRCRITPDTNDERPPRGAASAEESTKTMDSQRITGDRQSPGQSARQCSVPLRGTQPFDFSPVLSVRRRVSIGPAGHRPTGGRPSSPMGARHEHAQQRPPR